MLFNQLTVNETELEVFVGPVEATAIGNLVFQRRALRSITGSLENMRFLLAKNFEVKSNQPILTGTEQWEE